LTIIEHFLRSPRFNGRSSFSFSVHWESPAKKGAVIAKKGAESSCRLHQSYSAVTRIAAVQATLATAKKMPAKSNN